MAISINWGTKVIFIPQADLTNIGVGKYRLDVDQFRLALRDLEDSVEGAAADPTHNHSTAATLSGTTYARQVEIINGYTVEFENGMYQVECVGANHNIGDVKVVNSVSLIIGNSAGLIAVDTGGGGGATAADIWSYHTRTLTQTVGDATAASQAVLLALVDELEARLTATRANALDNLDAAVSSRLASGAYTAPDNGSVAAIKAKTDNLPAAPAAVGSDMGLTVAAVDAILDDPIEGTYTLRQVLRIIAAVVAGNATGLEGASPVFRDLDNTKDRLEATYAAGTRTVTARDVS